MREPLTSIVEINAKRMELQSAVFVLFVLSLFGFLMPIPEAYVKQNLVQGKPPVLKVVIRTSVALCLFLFCLAVCTGLFVLFGLF